MKRDMDLIRDIMQDIESIPANEEWDVKDFGRDPIEVRKHLELLVDAKLISGDVQTDLSGSKCWVNNIAITWLGYEFLDASRSNKIWSEIKSKAIEKGISLTFDGLLKALKVATQVGIAVAVG